MKIENAVPYLGALVTDLDVKHVTDDEWKRLYQTWLDRHVLIVRGQDLSKGDFLAYSRRFGRLKPHLVKHTRDPENPEITLMGVTSMAKDTKGEKLILDRGQGWHTDSPWDAEICKGTQLYAIEIPSYGGDTLFASMHAAYDALPERLKKRIASLKVEFRYGGRERVQFDLLDPDAQARPPAVHAMVRVHSETGRKSLYVNPIHVIRPRHVRNRKRPAARRALLVHVAAQRRVPAQVEGRRPRHLGQPLHRAFGRWGVSGG
jgi:taurine dioxygenase